MRVLESERLLIKPVEERDLPGLLELRWDADVMRYLIHEAINEKEQNDWFKSLNTKKNLALSIFLKKDGALTLVGTVGLYEIDTRHQRAVWRIRLTPAVQGMGIGFEATRMTLEYGFRTMNLHKITSNSMAENAAIIKMTHKLGFQNEGILRSHYYFNGRFRDAIMFGMLKDEFEAMDYNKK